MRKLLLAAVALSCISALPVSDAPKLTIHEWGTFTSLQDEAGRAVSGINADVEPIPTFVHTLPISAEIDNSKGFPIHVSHRDITMRLETPVIYFHLRDDVRALTIDVRESFRGGWLTQFYPDAAAVAPDSESKNSHITPSTLGTLTWKNLKIGGTHSVVETKSPIWLAPRDVQAADVVNEKGEAERFLFDRGVGNIPAPVSITRNGSSLEIRSQVDPSIFGWEKLAIRQMWLLDVRPDGRIAFRSIGMSGLLVDSSTVIAKIAADFREQEYSPDLKPLLESLHAGLVQAGLNSDEASALLNTWQAAYFKSQGQRVLFLAPRPWTDHYLPLDVSVPCDRTRVMVARIELVTPQYRDMAKRWTTKQDTAALEGLNHWRFGTPLVVSEWAARGHS